MKASVRGAEDFLALSKRLKATGQGELRKELARSLRLAVKPLTPKTRAEARHILPHAGGLAELVAKEPQRVQVRTGAATAGVRLVVGKNKGAARAADAGAIRHPVFGTDRFVTQPVPPGWFTATAKGQSRNVRKDVLAVLETVAARATGG